jgi:hypothetical protein
VDEAFDAGFGACLKRIEVSACKGRRRIVAVEDDELAAVTENP